MFIIAGEYGKILTIDLPRFVKPDVWPRLWLIVFATCIIVKLIVDKSQWGSIEPYIENMSAATKNHDNKMVLLGLLVILSYPFLSLQLGFIIATLILTLVYSVIAGEARKALIIATSIAIVIVASLVFQGVFYMPLPKGSGIFYYFSQWVEAMIINIF